MYKGYNLLRETLIQMTGWDLNNYKSPQLERRLTSLMQKAHVSGLADYAGLLSAEPGRIHEIQEVLTINVSEFFRNAERFAHLEQAILPGFGSRPVSVWSAGCANGSEPYSIAMVLEDAGLSQYSILATDIDPKSLEHARRACYNQREIAGVSTKRLAKYMHSEKQMYSIIPAVKAKVRFQSHNLLSDRYPGGFDLIVCRNVLIYFTDDAKQTVLHKFNACLKPQGVLFLGSTETLFSPAEYGFRPVAPFFYRKIQP